MTIEVFFNKPVRPFDVSKLIADVRGAQRYLAIASAWFTDIEIARAFIDAPARNKFVILNGSDIARGSKRAYEMIKDWDDKRIDRYENPRVVILGGDDWKEGVMHHKFVLIDSQVVWVGSYNLTFQARNNYETILKITDNEVFKKFWSEALNLQLEDALFMGGGQFARSMGAFRCIECEKLFPDSAIGYNGGSYIMCVYCNKERQAVTR